MQVQSRQIGHAGIARDGDLGRRRRPVGPEGQAARRLPGRRAAALPRAGADLRLRRVLPPTRWSDCATQVARLGRRRLSQREDQGRSRQPADLRARGAGARGRRRRRRGDGRRQRRQHPQDACSGRSAPPRSSASPTSRSRSPRDDLRRAGLRPRARARRAWPSPPASMAGTSPTSKRCSTPARSTSCRPTSRAAAASPTCCARRAVQGPLPAFLGPLRAGDLRARLLRDGDASSTSSTSTTTSASRASCSTGRSTRRTGG